jgi:hypothetical protein
MTKYGRIAWIDLTVPNAADIRDFYSDVVGWESAPLSMGDYDDYIVQPPGEEAAAGICHQQGPNANIPSQWMIYITVESVDASAERCRASGGKVIEGPRKMGDNKFCIIQDPAGAVAALIEE